MKTSFSSSVLLLSLLATLPAVAKDIHATVVYDDKATEINPAQNPDGTDELWITTGDLARATRFEVKPQGVCREELCFPIPKAKRQEFLRESSNEKWFNLLAFAQLVHQAVAHDEAQATWYFGLRSDQRQTLSSLETIDFSLTDTNGQHTTLSPKRFKTVF